jgi:hypothetical protein
MVRPTCATYVFPKGLDSQFRQAAQLWPAFSLIDGDRDEGPTWTLQAFRERK